MENTKPTGPDQSQTDLGSDDAVLAEVDALSQQLAKAEASMAEMRDTLLRERAEIENQRRRLQRDLEQARKFANEKLLAELLPVCDGLERGLAVEGGDVASMREGMQQGIFSVQQACPHCGGSGKTIANPCKTCHGEGRVQDERTLEVKIPAGVDSGDRIRLSGQGEAGPAGTSPGDLYVEVRVREHAIFQREGDDLYCEVPIRFSQAALGAELKVPTLDGEAIITLPYETQTGKLFRLRGKGVRNVRSGHKGDLHCRVVVETPVKLSKQQRELMQQFEATFAEADAAEHTPRATNWLDGVKRFWDRMTS